MIPRHNLTKPILCTLFVFITLLSAFIATNGIINTPPPVVNISLPNEQTSGNTQSTSTTILSLPSQAAIPTVSSQRDRLQQQTLATIAEECNVHQRNVKTNCFIVEESYFKSYSRGTSGKSYSDKEEKLLVPLAVNPGAQLFVDWYQKKGGKVKGLVTMTMEDLIHMNDKQQTLIADFSQQVAYTLSQPCCDGDEYDDLQTAPSVGKMSSFVSLRDRVSELQPIQKHLFWVLFNHSLSRRFEFLKYKHLATGGTKGRKLLKKSPLPCSLHPQLGLPLQHPFVSFHRNHLKPLTIEWIINNKEQADSLELPTIASSAKRMAKWKTKKHEALASYLKNGRSDQQHTVLSIGGMGYFQAHVSGGYFTNMWHTVGDYYNLLFHTLSDFWTTPLSGCLANDAKQSLDDSISSNHKTLSVEENRCLPPITWLTRTPYSIQGKGCRTSLDCRSYSLFDPFRKAFKDRVVFIDDEERVASDAKRYCDAKRESIESDRKEDKQEEVDLSSRQKSTYLHFPFVFLGLKNECSPIPMKGVGSLECQRSYRAMRDFTLTQYGLDPAQQICPHSSSNVHNDSLSACVSPFIHIMSRQKDKYRYFTPFEEMVSAIKKAAQAHTSSPQGGEDVSRGKRPRVEVVVLHGGMSFADQLQIIHNTTLLVAGRGGGTALSLFLPVGAAYLSISGHDKWNPWRDLQPDWYHLGHYTATFVHHEDPNRSPQLFGGNVDGNRAAYKVNPDAVGGAVATMLKQIDGKG